MIEEKADLVLNWKGIITMTTVRTETGGNKPTDTHFFKFTITTIKAPKITTIRY